MRPTRGLRPPLVALAAALLLILAAAPGARADSAAISVLDTAGQSDPAAGLPRTFHVSGVTAAPEEIFVKYRNPGGAACAPSAYSDSGSTVRPYYDDFWDDDVNGSFDLDDVVTWGSPGTYMFCVWIADDQYDAVQPITQMITFRSPTGTISATLSPPNPAPGTAAAITIAGVSEASEAVYATVHTAGIPCAQTFDADDDLTGSSRIDYGTAVNGAYSIADSVQEDTAGGYTLCLWLADSSSDATPVAGPQPIPFTVGTPAPPVTAPAPAATKKTASATCTKARKARTKWTKTVQKTKRSLLKTHRHATRVKLTKRLKAERRKLKTATANVRVIC
jgi:hypothetical protein